MQRNVHYHFITFHILGTPYHMFLYRTMYLPFYLYR